jgi:hypothetical protein
VRDYSRQYPIGTDVPTHQRPAPVFSALARHRSVCQSWSCGLLTDRCRYCGYCNGGWWLVGPKGPNVGVVRYGTVLHRLMLVAQRSPQKSTLARYPTQRCATPGTTAVTTPAAATVGVHVTREWVALVRCTPTPTDYAGYTRLSDVVSGDKGCVRWVPEGCIG